MRTLLGFIFLFATGLTFPSQAAAQVECVQDELSNLGYQPGPTDGVLGRRTRGAAIAFENDAELKLPELTDDSAGVWCSEIRAFAVSPAAAIFRLRAADLLPVDMLRNFFASAPERRHVFCHATSSATTLSYIRPVTRIEGFSSRMRSNRGPDSSFVPGARNVETFVARFSNLAAHAIAAEDDELKGALLDMLHRWAVAGAFLDTYACNRGQAGCTQWTVPDGSDLSRVKDWEFAVNHASAIIRAYYITLADHQSSERHDQHADILEWITAIGKMLKPAHDIPQVYFLGEVFWPVIVNDYATGNSAAARAKLERIARALDQVVLSPDGSIYKATNRGDRALWYHFYGLSMIVPTMEMIRAAGIPIPENVEDRLHKAVALFLAALDKPEILEPWARQQRNATYDGTQDFSFTGWTSFNGGGSWLHIYPYRYPEREEALQLRKLVSTMASTATKDNFFGLGLGCMYNAASDFR